MSIENEDVNPFDDEPEVIAEDDLEVVVDDSVESDEAVEDTEGEEAEEESPAEEPEEDPAPAEAIADDEDAELSAMPEKIKKRFAREKRLRDTIIQEREQIKTAAMQVASLAKQREDEVLTLKRQNAALQRQFAETLDYAYEKDISIKAGELRRARDDGNYEDEIKRQSELDTLRFQHNQVRQAKTTLPDPDKMAVPQPQQQAPQQQAPQQEQRKAPPPLAVKWVKDNQTWFSNPKFEEHKAAVMRIDAKLTAEGYDPGSKDYYQELDSRVDTLFPNLRKKRKAAGSPVAPAGNTPSRGKSKNTITITRSDLANMRRFGLDPSNKEQLREYAISKRAS